MPHAEYHRAKVGRRRPLLLLKTGLSVRGQKLVGQWQGQAADILGLRGTADKQAFDLATTLKSVTGDLLIRLPVSDFRVGYDLKWSAPKLTRVFFALTGDEAILDSSPYSISETMREMKEEMSTRLRKAGQEETGRATGVSLRSST